MSRFSPTIIRYDSVGSTNTEAARLAAAGAREGTCVVAREQTAGRGRLERQWHSPMDAGLYFSIVLRPELELKSFPLITLMASLAVREALEIATGISTDIKWPNDILANDRKLCGILAETVETQGSRAVILGIGINLTTTSFPPELSDVATSVESVTGDVPELELLLETLTETLARRYEMLLSANGDRMIVDDWQRASSYADGKHVRVSHSGEQLSGITRGLEPDGALRLATSDGRIELIRAGDVTAVRPVSRDLSHA
jgi:BirA family transcriptional regulator, biotin operon repressor / biotin---[acetyl-CoA-carboxylase] ligase